FFLREHDKVVFRTQLQNRNLLVVELLAQLRGRNSYSGLKQTIPSRSELLWVIQILSQLKPLIGGQWFFFELHDTREALSFGREPFGRNVQSRLASHLPQLTQNEVVLFDEFLRQFICGAIFYDLFAAH